MENKEFDFSQIEDLPLENEFADDLAEDLVFLQENKPADPQPASEITDETHITSEQPEDAQPEQKSIAKSKKDKKTPWQKSFLMYVHDLIFLLAGIIVVFLLLFRVVVVSGTSMNSTLLDGDYLLLLGNVFYRNPQPGDIIVASKESFDNGSPIVKRVIATEGQWVDIDFDTGVVYVGDTKDTMVALDEPYTLTPTTMKEGVKFPLEVDKGCLFVLGDNRDGSKDSRNPEIGLIDRREVLGKVIFLFMPGTNKGQTERDYDRIGVVS